MSLYASPRTPWLGAATAASLLTLSTFAALLIAFLNVTEALSGPGAAQARSGTRTEAKPPGPLAADLGGDSALEVPIIDIGKRGDGVVYRLGSREVGSAAGLQQLLEPLAKLGGSISVRIGHDVPFGRSAEAIAACRDAGFATVSLFPREPGH